jgi:hypothetical protein
MGWVFQDAKELGKSGSTAKWYAGWRDAGGRRHTKRIGSRSLAREYVREMEGQVANELCSVVKKLTWDQFRKSMRQPKW